jgi:hypothetical protein
MRKPVVITTPPATPEDVARILGISRKRAAELSKLAEEVSRQVDGREKRESRKRARTKTPKR